jgi:hypothetical protein
MINAVVKGSTPEIMLNPSTEISSSAPTSERYPAQRLAGLRVRRSIDRIWQPQPQLAGSIALARRDLPD